MAAMPSDFPLVPRFCDASIRGLDAASFEDVASVLTNHLDGARWERADEIQSRVNSRGDSKYAVFLRKPEPAAGIPAVHLFLLATGSDEVSVANIVPTESGSIDVGQYNAVLDDFMTSAAGPAALELSATVEVSADHYDLRTEFGKEIADRLVRFSALANKSTGSSHPSDRDRWYEFLVAAHQARRDATSFAGMVGDWLELDGWSSEVAHDLVIEFEFAMGLLDRA